MSSIQKSLLEPALNRFFTCGELNELAKDIKKVVDDQLRILPSQAAFSSLMTKFYGNGVDLINSTDSRDSVKHKTAGLTIFDCLLDVNDESEPQRRIEIAGHISKLLENDKITPNNNIDLIKVAASSIGHFARVASIAEIDFLQNFFLPLAMKNISDTRSESRRYSGIVILQQLALNSPILVYGKRKAIFSCIWDLICDKNALVRAAAAETLEAGLQLTSQREAISEYVKTALKQVDTGFNSAVPEKIIGGLLLLDIIVDGTVVTINELHNAMKALGIQASDLIAKAFARKDSRDPEVRQKLLEVTPNLASAFSGTFVQQNSSVNSGSFLNYSVKILTDFILAKRDRQQAYNALGNLFTVMAEHFKTSTLVGDVYNTICLGFKDPFCPEAIQCLGMVVNVSVTIRRHVDVHLIDQMFRGGLTIILIENLKTIIKQVPHIRNHVQYQLQEHIVSILIKYDVIIESYQSRIGEASKKKGYSVFSKCETPKDTKTKGWNSGGGLFGMRSDTSKASASNESIEAELIFAMDVLSIPEFFSKQARDRVTTSITSEDDQNYSLLSILRDAVVRYLDDYNPSIRKAAVKACATVLDGIVSNLDQNSDEFYYLYQILDKLLMMGVGDDSVVIRGLIFTLLTPSLDHLISLTNNVHCLIEALNDESLDVQAAAMTVLARVAHHDTLHIMPVVRLTIKRLVVTLKSMKDHSLKLESVRLLQALVNGSDTLIIPYVKEMLDPLLVLLNDSSVAVVIAALSTLGDLTMASPDSIREHLNELSPRLIAFLNDQSSIAKQEVAVVAVGKLVSSLTLITDEPYKKYDGLFEGLVKAIQTTDESATPLRLQAMKTAGLLGAVDANVYHKHLTNKKRVVGNFSSQIDNMDDYGEEDEFRDEKDDNEEEDRLSKMEKYNSSVVIKELMNILRDSTLSSYHLLACSVAIKTARILGAQASPQLDELLGGILFRLYEPDSANNLKDALLDHIISLILIMGKTMRPYIPKIIKVITSFFDTHLQLTLDILESACIVFSTPDVDEILHDVMPTVLAALDAEASLEYVEIGNDLQEVSDNLSITNSSASSAALLPRGSMMPISLVSNNKKSSTFKRTSKIMQKLVNLSEHLSEYRRHLMPFFIKILDSAAVPIDIRKEALCVMMYVSNDTDLQEYSSKIIHPLLRIISSANSESSIQSAGLSALSCMICRLGTGYIPYVIPVHRQLQPLRLSSPRLVKLDEYEALVARVLKQRPLPPEPAEVSDIGVEVNGRIRARALSSKIVVDNFEIGIQSLETAWALAGRNSASDLVEWVRRLNMELIRQSPSPVIRACATLAKTYRPLADELFKSSFSCVWDELFEDESDDRRDSAPVIKGIELALQSPQVPNNITTALLNLAEFMELQDKRLPIYGQILSRKAQAANMFGKALRYREKEFSSKIMLPSTECIDGLISVNNQLGSFDRAVGVLQYIRKTYPHIDIQPLWLEQLSRWEDARQVYDSQLATINGAEEDIPLPKRDGWISNKIGKLRCLHALGEYEELEIDAKKMKEILKTVDAGELSSDASLSEVHRLGANAAWMLGKWDSMEDFLQSLQEPDANQTVVLEQHNAYYQAIFLIHNEELARASALISETRNSLSNSISSLLSESYSRAYRAMVTMQTLSELEEVIEYKEMAKKYATDMETWINNNSDVERTGNRAFPSRHDPNENANIGNFDLYARKDALLRKWKGRLKWAPKEIDVYRQILAVHTLVAEPIEDLDSWLELVALCRKEGMFSLSENILRKLGAPIPNKQSGDEGSDALDYNDDVLETLYLKADHRVLFSTFMHFWFKGERSKALTEITKFLNNNKIPKSSPINDGQLKSELEDVKMFRVHCLLKQADFMRELKEGSVTELLATLTEAKELAGDQYSVWHAWAVANYDQLKKADAKDSTPIPAIAPAVPLPFLAQPQHSRTPSKQTHYSASAALGKLSNFAAPRKGSASIVNLLSIQQVDSVTQHVVEGIKGFVRSIILGEGQPVANILQDTLQLLTLWFSYGTKKGVYQILESELDKILPQNWLSVIPQLIARIHVKSPEISGLLRRLLVKVAVKHPQALVCPIFVALNTNDIQQKLVAAAVLQEVRKLQPTLVEEATMVSRELMRVAITPHELWYDGLEQAAQQYMDGSNLHSMLSTLSDLHEAMNEGTTNIRSSRRMEEGFSEGIGKIGNTTLRDISFRHNYSQSLYEAQCWLEQYKKTERTADLHQAWEIYQLLFKKIKVQISTLKKIELEHISPALTKASNLSLAIPGSYRPSAPVVSIRGFSSTIQVISSKQRPRRVALLGSDGKTYPFLLKGHEDLRQDERVMQLFGLINVCLDNDRTTSNRSLGIVRYSVLPLSNNSGLIGWVQNCDTMNQLIKQYREAKNVRLLLEAKLQQAKCQNYDKLPLMHKVEIFKKVHEECTGQDLAKMLWLRSKSSDVWIERRDNFTKSLAVMSMAGYILGLGDRHPSNLMIERVTGNVVHIDFGDCFEITAQRSRYPEIIPFRLTRMLINCMEASGIEGTYRLTAERVMNVLRENRDSVMAMLEAFVYDPLITWRLLNNRDDADANLSGNDEDMSESRDAASAPDAIDKLRDHIASSLLGGGVLEAGAASIRVHGGTRMDGGGGMSMAASTMRDLTTAGKIIANGAADGSEPITEENVNARALEIITRIQAKLTGKDFVSEDDPDDQLTVSEQVDQLIKEATSPENLCQLFSGWCPLW